jgi:hypothetical protein
MKDGDMSNISELTFSEDLLCGADAVAEFLFGDPKYRRKVYYLWQKSKMPLFKLKSKICGRKSKLLKYVEDQENRRAADGRGERDRNAPDKDNNDRGPLND